MVETVTKLSNTVSKSWVCRTWKREVAILLLFVWVVISFMCFCPNLTSEYRTSVFPFYTVLTGAVVSFAMGAFGLDAVAKQLKQATP